MTTIGFIGLGNMGGPMAARLVAAGHAVRGYDLTAAGPAELAGKGGYAANSAVDAVAGADAVVTMLPAGGHVRAVLTGPDGVFNRVPAGTLVVDCSTIDVQTAKDLHAAAADKGLPFLDAPVSGGMAGAAAGTLTFMVGGNAEALARATPLLDVMGRTVVHAGGAGMGQAAKLCNNMILGISMVAVAEAFALADRLGLSDQALFDIASRSSGQCWSLTSYCPVPGPVPGAPANRDYQAGFATALMLKDLTLALEAERAGGAPTVLAGHALDAFRALAARGWGDKDFSVVARALRDGGATPPSLPAGGGAG